MFWGLLALLLVANGAPLAVRMVLGGRWAAPLDGGRPFIDGRPLLGPSKTWRGLIASLLATTAVAPLVGLAPGIGALMALGAMAGDLASSFLKRRLGLASGARALGLDQFPEALLPLLLCQPWLHLGWGEMAGLVLAFAVGDLLLSRLMWWLGFRHHPY